MLMDGGIGIDQFYAVHYAKMSTTSNVKREHQHLLVIIKILAVIGIVSVSTKLSQQTAEHTTLRLASSHDGTSDKSRWKDDTSSTSELTAVVEQFDIPIFLMDPTTHDITAMEWKSIAQQWDRNTQYGDILQSNNTIDASIPFQEDKRVLIFHHLMPKTASSTLRQSCQDTQLETCGIEPKGPGNKRPDGYMTAKRLIQVMNECPKTRHYCVRADTQPLIRNYTQFHETNTFLHLFPFRNYDEWAVSALRQIYFRDGEKGCVEEDELLDRCLPHRYELDFDRYGKASMSYFLKSWQWLRKKKLGFENHHYMLMYDYRYLHETLNSLNEKYDIPLLSGTDAKKNSERPEGTCKDDAKMLKKFHECFSDGLGGLE